MERIEENVKDRIKVLHADGCKPKEIKTKVRMEFNKEISSSTMHYIIKGKKAPGASKPAKKKAKRSLKLDRPGESPEDIIDKIHELIDTLAEAYIKKVGATLMEAISKAGKE